MCRLGKLIYDRVPLSELESVLCNKGVDVNARLREDRVTRYNGFYALEFVVICIRLHGRSMSVPELREYFRGVLHLLLDHGLHVRQVPDYDMCNVLSLVGSDVLLLKKLLSNGLDVNEEEENGSTPLRWMLWSITTVETSTPSLLGTIRMLVEAGADPGVSNRSGETAFMTLCSCPMTEHTFELFLEWLPLVNVNHQDNKGRTALMHLANGDWHETTIPCRMILDAMKSAGADPHIETKDGNTALCYAKVNQRCPLDNQHRVMANRPFEYNVMFVSYLEEWLKE